MWGANGKTFKWKFSIKGFPNIVDYANGLLMLYFSFLVTPITIKYMQEQAPKSLNTHSLQALKKT